MRNKPTVDFFKVSAKCKLLQSMIYEAGIPRDIESKMIDLVNDLTLIASIALDIDDEILEAEKRGFNAAEEYISIPFLNRNGAKTKDLLTKNYLSFSDYKNGISQGSLMMEKINAILDEIKEDYKK